MAGRLAQDASVQFLPGLHLRRKVAYPRLFVLAGRVQGEALRQTGLGGHRVEDRFTLLLRAAVDHTKEGVRPVLVDRALVAVGDRLVLGERVADLLYPRLGYLPDAHRICPKARLTVVENGREAAHDLAPLQIVRPLQKLLSGEPDLSPPQVERPRSERHVLLQSPD